MMIFKGFKTEETNFKEGNNECAVIIPNKELAKVFARQFEKDWNYSKPNVPEHIWAC